MFYRIWLCCAFAVLFSCGGKEDLKQRSDLSSEDSVCMSELWFEGACVDPDADDDRDGLTNGIEILVLGTNPKKSDTDDDGIGDLEEVGDIISPSDTDGDSIIDALESAILDPDADCLPDQFDPQNEIPNKNVEHEIAKIHCVKKGGVCFEFLELIKASCIDGRAVCDYSSVPGYEDVETLCDNKDNDCDGETDVGGATGCAI